MPIKTEKCFDCHNLLLINSIFAQISENMYKFRDHGTIFVLEGA